MQEIINENNELLSPSGCEYNHVLKVEALGDKGNFCAEFSSNLDAVENYEELRYEQFNKIIVHMIGEDGVSWALILWQRKGVINAETMAGRILS